MKTALVTGATSGIGHAIAIALHAAGYMVTGVGRNVDGLRDLDARGIRGLQLDLANTGQLKAALKDSTPDVLVNNAGTMPPLGRFCDMAESDIDSTITVNLRSAIGVTHILAPAMRARGTGHIFFTGSTAGHAPFANLAVYAATKAAIGAFAQSLRLELAPSGVRVTEIVAGRVESNLYKDILPQDTRDAMYANNSAVQPKDIAEMVMAVLALPPSVDVARFDILPTHQATATGVKKG
jgi:3-hydroxy acid dehydrogenase/malonic semialdehyde reductase